MRQTQVLVTGERRVIRYRKDQVGNDLTAVLRWCATHHDPIWQFGDGSLSPCPGDRYGHSPHHEVIDAPWEDRIRLRRVNTEDGGT